MSEAIDKQIIDVFNRMIDISNREPRSLLALALKTAEETGELAEEVLIECNESTKSPGKDGVIGESIDVILMAISIFVKHGGTPEDFIFWANKKMNKWERNMMKRTKK